MCGKRYNVLPDGYVFTKAYFTSLHIDSMHFHKNCKIRHLGLKCLQENRLIYLCTNFVTFSFFCKLKVLMKSSTEWILAPVCWGSPAENLHFSCLELFFFPLFLSKAAHTFVLCPTHFPLSFFYAASRPPISSLPPQPFPLCLSTYRLKTGMYHMSHSPLTVTLLHSVEWYNPALHKFPLSGSCVEASTGRIISPFWTVWMYV